MPYMAPAATFTPDPVNFLELFGHSYFSQPVGTGTTTSAITSDQTGEMTALLAGALSLDPSRVRNHAVTSSQLSAPGRSQCGFARVLAETTRKRQTFPFLRSGGVYVGCWGINDCGHQGTSATVQSVYKSGLRAFISRARSSAIYLASGGANWAFGTNFTAAAATFASYTSGAAMRATAIDSAGTSTATFTIPIGYKGEPITFAFLGAIGATGGTITWGGTVAGTSGIQAATTVLSSQGITGNGYGLVCVRFTAAANGLSAANAGQTITMKITAIDASGEVIIDSAWIEASKPNGVVVCNVPRLSCRKFTLAVGDGASTSASTTFTSATAQFASGTDASNAIVETDAQGAIPANTTISSVTNATTVVLSQAAAATKTAIQFTVARNINGYAQYAENTNFSGATPASHAAADTDVATYNTWISAVVAEFDSMVQIADLDTALGQGDTILPATLYTYFALIDGIHPNEGGNARCARAIFDAIAALAPVDPLDLGSLSVQGTAAVISGPIRRPRRSGQYYLPEFGAWGTTYTAVAGDTFALPFFVTEATENWGTALVQQTNAPATAGSNVRWAVYDDINYTGYPQALVKEPTSGAALAMGTAAVVKTLTSVGWNIHYGLYWIVFKIDSLGTTASVFNQINGPNPYLPQWTTTGGTASPIGWKLTGQAAGALPVTFPTGATLVTSAPAIAILVNT